MTESSITQDIPVHSLWLNNVFGVHYERNAIFFSHSFLIDSSSVRGKVNLTRSLSCLGERMTVCCVVLSTRQRRRVYQERIRDRRDTIVKDFRKQLISWDFRISRFASDEELDHTVRSVDETKYSFEIWITRGIWLET
jgi:hypothetical protein